MFIELLEITLKEKMNFHYLNFQKMNQQLLEKDLRLMSK